MAVPLVDLKAQYAPLQEEIQLRIGDVLSKMDLFLGENVVEFEREFAELCGARYGVGVGSGTDALVVALRALGIGPGDEVITVSHTFAATAEAIVIAGATPVFVDIDPTTYAMDPKKVQCAIGHRTRAMIPVHLYGHPADIEPLLAIAERRGLRVVEDASQAHGALYRSNPVGSFGDVGCFSFYYSKNLGAYGEAGMIVTSDEDLADRAKVLRDHGSTGKYAHTSVGYNSRLDEIQAAILRAKLPHLEDWNERRWNLAQTYNRILESLPLILPVEQSWARHVYHLYVVRTPERDSLYKWLHARGIQAGIHYPTPVHGQPAYKRFRTGGGQLPVTELVASEVLSLPMYPEMEPSQLEEVACAVHDYFAADGSRNGHVGQASTALFPLG